MDTIIILIIAILNFLLILSFVREIFTLRKENAALAQALMNEEKAAMGMASRNRPGNELSDWQTSADEMSDVEAECHRFVPEGYVPAQIVSFVNEGSMGTRDDPVQEKEYFWCSVGWGVRE